MSIVIVEGPDGSGKTTLLRRLRETSKTYFWIASSSSRPKTVAQILDVMHFTGQCVWLKFPLICDRFPLISEAVYGPVMRGSCLLDELNRAQGKEAAGFLSEQVERIIYCRPPKDQIIQNLNAVQQMTGVPGKIRELIVAYDRLMEELSCEVPVFKYDYTDPHPDWPIERIFFGSLNGQTAGNLRQAGRVHT